MALLRKSLVLVGVGLSAISFIGAPATAQATSILERLNATRAEAGLGVVSENPNFSSGCAQHVNYMLTNNLLVHGQDPSLPGASAEGAWAGGRSGVAKYAPGQRESWPHHHEGEPFHAMRTLSPALTGAGIATAQHLNWEWSCVLYRGALTRQGVNNTIKTYPAAASSQVPTAEMAWEQPFTPGELIGIPQRTITGPYIYVFADGPWVRRNLSDPTVGAADFQITRAEMRRSDGVPVAIRTVDKTVNKWWTKIDMRIYIGDSGGIIIPLQPLQPHTAYTVTVDLVQSIPDGVPTNAWCQNYLSLPASQQILGPVSICRDSQKPLRDQCDSGLRTCWTPVGPISHTFTFRTGAERVAGQVPSQAIPTPAPEPGQGGSGISLGDDDAVMDLPVVSRTRSGPCDRRLRGRARIGGEWTEVMGYRRASHRVVSSRVRGRRAQVRLCTRAAGRVMITQKGVRYRAKVSAGTRTLVVALPKAAPRSLRLSVRLKGLKPVVTVVALKTSHR